MRNKGTIIILQIMKSCTTSVPFKKLKLTFVVKLATLKHQVSMLQLYKNKVLNIPNTVKRGHHKIGQVLVHLIEAKKLTLPEKCLCILNFCEEF